MLQTTLAAAGSSGEKAVRTATMMNPPAGGAGGGEAGSLLELDRDIERWRIFISTRPTIVSFVFQRLRMYVQQ